MDNKLVLKAIADQTRMKILILLLKHNYCVKILAKNLELTEATISQHLKVFREAGLIIGEKRGYFMHYSVERSVLHELAKEIEALANIEQEACNQENSDCKSLVQDNCHAKSKCSDETKEFCHGKSVDAKTKEEANHGHCKCHES